VREERDFLNTAALNHSTMCFLCGQNVSSRKESGQTVEHPDFSSATLLVDDCLLDRLDRDLPLVVSSLGGLLVIECATRAVDYYSATTLGCSVLKATSTVIGMAIALCGWAVSPGFGAWSLQLLGNSHVL
jgi:hypothetical protein